jgi:hypothetical protein
MTYQVPLTVSGLGWLHPRLVGDDLAVSKVTMAGWLRAQTLKRETAAAKNELESYIISTRESLETDEVLMKVL